MRGFSGSDFKYTLTVRPRKPDFKVSIGGFSDGVPKGSGREFSFSVERKDNFNGLIRLDISDAPAGFHISTPINIEAEQQRAFGSVHANADAAMPENDFVTVTATATTSRTTPPVRAPTVQPTRAAGAQVLVLTDLHVLPRRRRGPRPTGEGRVLAPGHHPRHGDGVIHP